MAEAKLLGDKGVTFDDLIPRQNRFADLIPSTPPEEKKGFFADLIPKAKRLGGAFVGGFSESVEATGGFGISEETARQLGPLVSQTPEQTRQIGLGTVRTLNRLLFNNFVTVMEIGAATFEGAAGLAGQLAEEFNSGEDKLTRITARRNAMRFFRQVSDATIVAGATAPAQIVRRGTAARASQTKISKAADSVPDSKRTEFIERATKAVEDAIPNPIDPLDSARTKIGAVSIGTLNDAADYTIGQRAQIQIYDQLRPVKIAAEKGAKEAGVTPDLSPYNEMRLVAGSRGVVDAVIKRGTITRTRHGIEFNGKGLNDVLKPIADDLDDAMTYFAGRRAAELKKQKRERLFSDAEIEAMLKLETPAMKTAFVDYQAYNRRLLDFAEQSGLLNAETKARFVQMGQDYVPFYRVAIDEKGRPRRPGSPLFKRLRGGTENLNDISENIYRNTAMIVDASVKNAAKLEVYNTIDKFGLDDIATKIPAGQVGRVTIIDDELRKMVNDLGGDLPKDTVAALTYNRKLDDNIDVVFSNGKRVYYRIDDPVFAKAMHAFGPRNYEMALSILGFPKKVLTRATTLAPGFMATNLVRDTQSAFVQSKANFIPVVDTLRGLNSRLLRDDNYWLAMANGAGFSTLYKGEVAAGRDLRSLVQSDKKLTGDQKRKQIDDLRRMRNELFTGMIGSLPDAVLRQEGILPPLGPRR